MDIPHHTRISSHGPPGERSRKRLALRGLSSANRNEARMFTITESQNATIALETRKYMPIESGIDTPHTLSPTIFFTTGFDISYKIGMLPSLQHSSGRRKTTATSIPPLLRRSLTLARSARADPPKRERHSQLSSNGRPLRRTRGVGVYHGGSASAHLLVPNRIYSVQ